MAITITWETRVINIPKSDLTLVQSTPIEIRELNLNSFRLILKDLEDGEDGIAYPQTHTHNTEVLLGGIVYARVIEIINGYTVTFENGTYAVNLVGANSNVGDVVNLNQVSVRSANAAGLISNQAIEFSSFNGGVTVDVFNGTTGTVFPRGTPQQPVNNIPDAIIIAELRGFNKIYINGDFIFGSGDILNGYTLIGQSPENSYLTFLSGAEVNSVDVRNGTIDGIFDGNANFTDCHIINSNFVYGTFKDCTLQGTITITGTNETILINCTDGLTTDDGFNPSIDFGGDGGSLGIRNYSGDLTLKNKAGTGPVEINMATGGHITLDNTITNGFIRVTGIAEVTNNSSSGATVDVSHVIYPDQLQLSSFNGQVYLNPSGGMSGINYPIGTLQNPSNNLADTLAICELRGLETILVDGTVVVTNSDISGKIFIGENNLDSVIYLAGGNTTVKTTFKNMIIAGQVEGHIYVESSALQTLSNVGSSVFPSIFRDCIIRANVGVTPAISLNSGSTQNIHFINCSSGVPGQGTATLDFNGSLTPIAFRKYGGGIELKNITGNQDSTFEFDQGQIKIDSSCTSGQIRLGGIYKLTNNGTLTLTERNQSITDNINFSGASFSADTELIASAVWDKLMSDHETANTFGRLLNDLLVASGQAQHSLNLNTELLKNKPNNP